MVLGWLSRKPLGSPGNKATGSLSRSVRRRSRRSLGGYGSHNVIARSVSCEEAISGSRRSLCNVWLRRHLICDCPMQLKLDLGNKGYYMNGLQL